MWMSVSQRTREIGVLRAVGWSRRSVMGMVFLEAAGIGLLACPLGGALGVGLALFTTIVPTVNQFVDPVFSAPTFLQAFAVAMLLSVIGAAMPSIRAANISPVEALRHE
jgi:putative ABC transport system permease protein